MARPAALLAAALALCLLPRGLAWYRPAAGPGHHSVGRAAGLLSGLRRAPHARRSDPPGAAAPELRAGLRGLAVCVRDVSPNLQSCERLPGGRAALQCRADVLLSLRAADCRGPDPAPAPPSKRPRE